MLSVSSGNRCGSEFLGAKLSLKRYEMDFMFISRNNFHQFGFMLTSDCKIMKSAKSKGPFALTIKFLIQNNFVQFLFEIFYIS